MPGDPAPMAETSGAMIVAPARVPRVERRFSDLPLDVLPRVLSCLDAREAVQTCVLSKLWRDLWRDVRRINASCRAFEGSKHDGLGRSPFNKFFSRLLMLRNPVSLDEFRLFYCIDRGRVYADSAEANLWICHALLCEARPVEIFASMERLELELNPAVFTLKHLTSLLLSSVVLNNGFFRQLLNGCRALERLILQRCAISDIEIASQTLKFLSIGHYCWFRPGPDDPAHLLSLSFSLPNLIHLGFFGHLPYDNRIPLVKNMESLQTAYIDFRYSGLLIDDIPQFLFGLSGVTKLEFCFGTGHEELMMGMDLQWCPKFNNLKFLSLSKWYLDANFYGLIAFLQNSPNLEHLVLCLKLKQDALIPGALMGWPGNRPFTCKHLKTVEIICLKDDPAVHSLREFLLAGGISDGQIHIKH